VHVIVDNYATHKHPRVQRVAGCAATLSCARMIVVASQTCHRRWVV